MLTQRILESQKFVNLVTRRNLALIAFSDVVSGYSGNNSEVILSDNLTASLNALSTDGISIVFITGGTHETFSRFTDMPGFVSLANYGLSLCDKTGVHLLKQAQPYRETMGELFDRLSLWLPTSIDIENRGVSIVLNYGGVLDHGKARKGLTRLLEETECLDRFNIVNHKNVMYVLPPVCLTSATLVAQLKQRFNFESVLLFGLNCFDDLMSSSTAMEQPSQLPLTYAEIESIAFDCSMSNLDSIVQEISEIRFQVNK